MSLFNPSEKDVIKRFGEEVRKTRKERGLSQEELAGAIEMDLTSINEIEQGHRSPKLITIYKIAKALKVPAKDLLPF